MNEETIGQAVIDAVWDTLKDLYVKQQSPFDDTVAEVLCVAIAQGVVAGLREMTRDGAALPDAAPASLPTSAPSLPTADVMREILDLAEPRPAESRADLVAAIARSVRSGLGEARPRTADLTAASAILRGVLEGIEMYQEPAAD